MTNKCRKENCIEISTVVTDLKWVKWGLYGGGTLVLSAIVYFNATVNASILKSNNMVHESVVNRNKAVSEVHELLMVSRNSHALGLAKLENKVDSFNLLCCEEIKRKEENRPWGK